MRIRNLLRMLLISIGLSLAAAPAAMAQSMYILEEEISSSTAVAYLTAFSNAESLDIFINSPGGELAAARAIAANMKKKKAVACYVKYAASAALEVIMPACTTIVVALNSTLKFHQVHLMPQCTLSLETPNMVISQCPMVNSKELREAAESVDRDNEALIAGMLERFPLISRELLSLHFYKETQFTPRALPADAFTTMFTRILTLEESKSCMPFNMRAERICPKS